MLSNNTLKRIKFCAVFILFAHCTIGSSQESIINYEQSDFLKHNLRINAIGLQSIYLKSLRVGYEYRFDDYYSAEFETGYTFFSREDNAKTNGIYTSASFNYTSGENEEGRRVIKLMPFYQILFMNHYLKYNSTSPVFGSYTEYKKTKYTKERFGLMLIFAKEINVGDFLRAEFSPGIGFIQYRTIVHADIAQNTFRNGRIGGANFWAPNISFNVKFGVAF